MMSADGKEEGGRRKDEERVQERAVCVGWLVIGKI